MTRFLAEQAEDLDRDTMVAISTVAVMFTALTTGVNVRTAAEASGRQSATNLLHLVSRLSIDASAGRNVNARPSPRGDGESRTGSVLVRSSGPAEAVRAVLS